jgi:heat shock protein HtpX
VVVLYLTNPAASPRLVALLYPGRVLHPSEAPRHYAVLGELARRAGLPRMPRLYYIPSAVMNAFATGGRDDALIAVSDGLLRRLDLRELTGVLAHETGHIANGDLRVMAFADLVSRIAGVFSLAGQILLFLSLPALLLGAVDVPWLAILILLAAPTLSALVQLALSRNREYEADRSAAELTGDPAGLAAALDKLERVQGRFWEQILMPGRRVPAPSLLRTHPETGERIARLMDLVPRRLPAVAGPLGGDGSGLFEALLDGRVRPPTRPPRRHLIGLWY